MNRASHGDMASLASPPAARASSERAKFTFSRPINTLLNGSEIELHGVDMRALETIDLPLLDTFQGQPVALALNVIAALCDLSVNEVRQLSPEDFGLLASDVLWQVEQTSVGMGLTADFFLKPRTGEVGQ